MSAEYQPQKCNHPDCNANGEWFVNDVCPRCERAPFTKPKVKGVRRDYSQDEPSNLEAIFLTRLKQLAPELPEPEAQYYFHAEKNWRLDFAWHSVKIGIEIDGGENMLIGGHTYGLGFVSDRVKQNAAVLQGWRVLRFVGSHITGDPNYVIRTIKELFEDE